MGLDLFGAGEAIAAGKRADADKQVAQYQYLGMVKMLEVQEVLGKYALDTQEDIVRDNNETKKQLSADQLAGKKYELDTQKYIAFAGFKSALDIATKDADVRIHESDNTKDVRLKEIELAGKELKFREKELEAEGSGSVETSDFLT